jgi:hypothetical protein
MTRIETVTTPPTPGAARRASFWFWPPQNYVTGSISGQTTGQFRPGGTGANTPVVNFTTTGAPPAGSGGQIFKGILTQALTSNLTSGQVITPNITSLPLVMPFQNVRSTADFVATELDDFRIWSVSAVLAFDQMPGTVVGDIGLGIGPAGRFGARAAGAAVACMEIGPSDVGQTSVVVRQTDGGAITFNQTTPFQPDITEFHLYEIRLYSASAVVEAKAVFLIDNKVQFSLSYGAGTLLPDQSIGGVGNMGMQAVLGNFEAFNGTTRMYVIPGTYTVKCAPNDASLL